MILDTTNKIIHSINIQLTDSTIKLDTVVNIHQLYLNLNQINDRSFWETWGNPIFGLVGVLIGAFIAYVANAILLKRQTISKFSIQRKNLIIAPLYKELLSLKEYTLESSLEGLLEIKYDNEYSHNYGHQFFKFLTWDEIKKDIRINYIPKKINDSLEDLIISISKYQLTSKNAYEFAMKLRSDLKIDELEYKQKTKDVTDLYFGGKSTYRQAIKDVYYLIKYRRESQIEEYFSFHELEYDNIYEPFNEALKNYFDTLSKETSVIEYIECYKQLEIKIQDSINEVNKYIKYVVNKFEFGKEIEKYD